jgi:plastocyanin
VSRRTQRVVAALSTAAMGSLLLAACVAANHSVTQPTPVFSPDVSATPGMAGTGSGASVTAMPGMRMTPSPSDGKPPAVPAGPNAVDINGFAFAPATLTVAAGTTVTWTNRDEDPHTVVAGDGAFRSQTLGSGGVYSFTFPAAGTFDYVCSIHPFMHGAVVVTP